MTALIDLRDFPAVFCDSVEAVAQLRSRGLPPSARILTTAPSLLESQVLAEDVEVTIPRSKVDEFIAKMNDFTVSFYQKLRTNWGHTPAIAATYAAFNEHRFLHKALFVRAEDLSEPRLTITLASGSQAADDIFGTFWPELLTSNANAFAVKCDISPPTHGKSLGGRPPSLLRRLSNLRLDRLLYRTLLAIDNRLPAQLFRNVNILVIRDSNELVRDTALAFALDGARIEEISAAPLRLRPLVPEDHTRIVAAMDSSFDSILASLYVPKLWPVLKTRLVAAACREVETAFAARNAWIERLKSTLSNGKRSIILHGGPMGATGAGLHAAATALDIPVVAFQHGVRREIANWPIDVRILNENNYSDLLICYNKASVRYSKDANPFAVGDSDSVGMPTDYRRQRRSLAPAKPPLIYVSTLLYRGTRQITMTSLSDHQRARREMELIDDVLNVLPHRVLYKPYPSFRYADQDPAITRAQDATNIDVFTHEVDLRYTVTKHRVVITSGATSTVGWCILSGKPLIYIHDSDISPLNRQALELFEDAFFVFDSSRPSFKHDIVSFLSQPLVEIESLAAERDLARQRLIKDFLGFADPHPGRTARDLIKARYLDHHAAFSVPNVRAQKP